MKTQNLKPQRKKKANPEQENNLDYINVYNTEDNIGNTKTSNIQDTISKLDSNIPPQAENNINTITGRQDSRDSTGNNITEVNMTRNKPKKSVSQTILVKAVERKNSKYTNVYGTENNIGKIRKHTGIGTVLNNSLNQQNSVTQT